MGKDGRVDVAVTFDERRGYVGSAPELRSPVVALSLDGLRRKIEALMSPDDVSSTSTRPLAWSAIADGSLDGRARGSPGRRSDTLSVEELCP